MAFEGVVGRVDLFLHSTSALKSGRFMVGGESSRKAFLDFWQKPGTEYRQAKISASEPELTSVRVKQKPVTFPSAGGANGVGKPP